MKHPIKLATIPEERYSDYRYNVIFNAYKWDPQVEDHNTVARHVVVLHPDTAAELKALSEQLSEETMQMEEALLHNLPLAKELTLPHKLHKALGKITNYDRNGHVRLMRFDFHPTTEGWKISEVNSDVPGGFAESSILPQIAAQYFPDCAPGESLALHLLNAFKRRLPNGGRIAMVHATSYSDDRQVMQFLGDYFTQNGFEVVYAAPDHLRWTDRKAHCIIDGLEGQIDGLLRFYPLEWLVDFPAKTHWSGFFETDTVSCSHPVAILAQSKRLPLVWDKLGVDIPMWKALLPETREARAKSADHTNWIYKPAMGRVGEAITIREAVTDKELKQIERSVKLLPKEWLLQKRFESVPLWENDKPHHLCLGVFTVDGQFAGFYARVSESPRIDAKAQDIPVLVAKEEN